MDSLLTNKFKGFAKYVKPLQLLRSSETQLSQSQQRKLVSLYIVILMLHDKKMFIKSVLELLRIYKVTQPAHLLLLTSYFAHQKVLSQQRVFSVPNPFERTLCTRILPVTCPSTSTIHLKKGKRLSLRTKTEKKLHCWHLILF